MTLEYQEPTSRLKDSPPVLYELIKQHNGQLSQDDLIKMVGNRNRVRYSITRLTGAGKIKRVKGFAKETADIEYRYRIVE